MVDVEGNLTLLCAIVIGTVDEDGHREQRNRRQDRHRAKRELRLLGLISPLAKAGPALSAPLLTFHANMV